MTTDSYFKSLYSYLTATDATVPMNQQETIPDEDMPELISDDEVIARNTMRFGINDIPTFDASNYSIAYNQEDSTLLNLEAINRYNILMETIPVTSVVLNMNDITTTLFEATTVPEVIIPEVTIPEVTIPELPISEATVFEIPVQEQPISEATVFEIPVSPEIADSDDQMPELEADVPDNYKQYVEDGNEFMENFIGKEFLFMDKIGEYNQFITQYLSFKNKCVQLQAVIEGMEIDIANIMAEHTENIELLERKKSNIRPFISSDDFERVFGVDQSIRAKTVTLESEVEELDKEYHRLRLA